MIRKLMPLAAAATLLAGSALAQSPNVQQTPGHQMQKKGPLPGSPGASGYAPGHTKVGAKAKVKAKVGAKAKATGVGANVNVKAKAKAKGEVK